MAKDVYKQAKAVMLQFMDNAIKLVSCPVSINGLPRLNSSENSIIRYISYNPGCTATVLVEQLDVTKGFISKSIKNLIDLGLIVRMQSKEDPKFKKLYLTVKGRDYFMAYSNLVAKYQSAYRDLYERYITAEETEVFMKVLSFHNQQVGAIIEDAYENYEKQMKKAESSKLPADAIIESNGEITEDQIVSTPQNRDFEVPFGSSIYSGQSEENR